MQCAFKCPSWSAEHGLTKPGLRSQGAIQHHSGDTSGVFEIQMHRIKPCTALVCWASWGDRKYLGGEGYDAWVSALLRSRTRQETSAIQSRGLAFYYLNPSCGKNKNRAGDEKNCGSLKKYQTGHRYGAGQKIAPLRPDAAPVGHRVAYKPGKSKKPGIHKSTKCSRRHFALIDLNWP